jgi:RNA ligase
MNEKIQKLINEGFLSYKEDGNLYLLNYTDKCTYEKHWVPETLNNRGHVYEKGTDKLIACPFSKFFNLGELTTEEQKQYINRKDYTITEKMDGSLGILYWYDGQWRMNTRGSFNSDQAKEGLKIFHEKNGFRLVNKSFTYLFEIIYPEDRKVIDYKNKRELILLSIFNNQQKEIVGPVNLAGFATQFETPVVTYYHLTYDQMFKFQESDDLSKEGFVVRFQDGSRVKIKSKRYFAIARILSNLSPLSLWKVMKDGKVNEEYLAQIPEEFREEVDIIRNKLQSDYILCKGKLYTYYLELMKTNPTRKEIGLNKNLKHKTAIFAFLDQKTKGIEAYIMKQIRPGKDIQ